MKSILGISAFYHDAAACLLKDGKIIAAAQEERFTRKKNDPSFPKNAIGYCLKEGGIFASDLELVAFYDKPLLKFERLVETYLTYAPKGLRSFLPAMNFWLREKLFVKDRIQKELGISPEKIIFPEHHESHAASAFYPSPFRRAAFLTMDGVGEWTTASFGVGSGNKIRIHSELKFPHSLGLLYSAFTYYLGFKVNDGEYKVMGLAPYGEPKYKDLILSKLLDLKDDGSFKMEMKYFNYTAGLTMTNENFHKLFGGPPKKLGSPPGQREMDLAKSLQEVLEEIVLKMAQHVHGVTGEKYLCLAGGVALNSVANGRLLKEGPFEDIWIQPAAGDAGGALGAALLGWHQYLGEERKVDGRRDFMQGAYLGPAFSDEDLRNFLDKNSIPYEEFSEDALVKKVSDLMAHEKVIGWFQGRMEFGPRALGSRSILADARSPRMQSVLNLKIKFRESFRPFAPAVLLERTSEYFELERESPYMLLVVALKKGHRREMTPEEQKLFGIDKLNVLRSDLPAVTHVDYSARVQTVSSETNPLFHKLISQFEKNYQCPVIINTSFNVSEEPIVCSPADAYRCFLKTNIDYLALGKFLLDKKAEGHKYV